MLRRIKAIAKKEVIHIFRDFRTLFLALAMPVFMILLFGYAIDFDIDELEVGVQDLDRSAESRKVIRDMTSGNMFRMVDFSLDLDLLKAKMGRGEIKMILMIPPGYGLALRRGEKSEIGVLVDGSNNNTATIAMNYLNLFSGYLNLQLLEEFEKQTGARRTGAILPAARIFFNPELESRYYILPGIIALIMAILSALLTSITVAREWEKGSMEQLITTPVRPSEIIAGKILPYIAISLIQVTLATALAVFLFQIPFRGNLMMLYAGSFFFAGGALGLGILLSSVLKAQLPAMQIAIVASMIPSILLSNFVFPIASMPAFVRWITYLIPARYYLTILRSVFLKGTGFEVWFAEVLFLTAFTLLVLTVAVKKTGRRIA